VPGGSAAEPGSAPPPPRHLRYAASPPVSRVLTVRYAVRVGAARDQGRGPDPVQRHRDELVTRLVHGSRRVEVAARPAAVVQDHASAVGIGGRTAPERRSAGTTSWADPPPGTARTTDTTSGAAPTGAGAAVDLDRLTDQIVTRLDSRLTAHRERFGRAF